MADGDCERVLVVEDNPEVREAIVDLLDDSGYQTSTAANGREAIDRLLAGERPNVILLDLMMPVMDGFQFRAAQRAEPELMNIPIVVLSAHINACRVAQVLGAAAGLQKPFKMTELVETLDRVCGPRPPRDEP